MQGEMLSSAVMKELTRGAVVIQKSILIQTIFINFLGLVSSTVGSWSAKGKGQILWQKGGGKNSGPSTG